MTWSILEDGRVAPAIMALNWLVQSSVPLILGLAAGWRLRRAGAATRSTVYRATLAAVLLCPVASLLLVPSGLGDFALRLPFGASPEAAEAEIETGAAEAPARAPDFIPANPEPERTPAPADPVPPAAIEGTPVAVSSLPPVWPTWIAIGLWCGLAAWLSGTCLLLARLIRAHRRTARLRAASVPAEPEATALCREIAARMGLAAPPVLRAPLLSSPCLVGLRRPAILLPDDLETGLDETLTHELAHLARRDLWWNLARSVAAALLWVQPLIRTLSRRLEATAEEVCDDVVLRHGADRTRYAGHLLDLAERTLPPAAHAGVGMVASPSSLGRRVRLILDAARPLSTRTGRRAVAASVAVASAVTLAAGLVGLGALPTADAASATEADEPKPGEAVSFSGRVIERETGKPIAGAAIVVVRSSYRGAGVESPPWAGETTLRSDADGRFTITFPPEQVASPRLSVALARIEHPDYIPRTSQPRPLADLLRDRANGDPPYFDTIKLERGLEYTGLVVAPDGRPAADAPYVFWNWGGTREITPFRGNDELLRDTNSGRTDAEGRIRLRMAKTHGLMITLTPESHAPFQKFWGTLVPGAEPDVFAPTDLGRIVLGPGVILPGRVVDRDGRPIAGQKVVASSLYSGIRREATSAADGSFRFTPLRPGNYDVFAENQIYYLEPILKAWPSPDSTPVIRPARVYLRAGERPDPVELREIPSVRVEARFVDSQGRPDRGNVIALVGEVPSAADRNPPRFSLPSYPSAIDKPEPENPDKRLFWGRRLVPDAEGRVVFLAPRGLMDADLEASPADGTVSYKTRLEPGGPLKYWGVGNLGVLDADRSGIEIVAYRAPTVLITIAPDDGGPIPAYAKPEVGFRLPGRGSYGNDVIRQSDGRFRTRSLMPDVEYDFEARAPGYAPKLVQRLSLPEGAVAELTLVLRKTPKPPAVGAPAPPFSVAALDGRKWTLDDFRGKPLLLHFWHPSDKQTGDHARLDAIRRRFGADRIALLGVCPAGDRDDTRKTVEGRRLDWPQAILRDWDADPAVQDYCGFAKLPATFLIGPDGKLLARDLTGDAIEKAVAEALGGK